MKAIVAMDLNRVIGNKGKIPWHLSEDLKWFKKQTMGGIVVVGWNTFRELPPLSGRQIKVVDFGVGDIDCQPATNDHGAEGTLLKLQREFPPKPDHYDRLFESQYWLCGGAKTYKFLMHCCNEVYATIVLDEYEGDTRMIPFEDDFPHQEILVETKKYWRVRYRRFAE